MSMNPFKWLFSRPRFERVPDAYTLSRSSLWREIINAVRFQQDQAACVWLIAHFADQFSEVQNRLSENRIDYQIVSSAVDGNQILEMSQSNRRSVILALAELLIPMAGISDEPTNSISLAMIAVERHPLITNDYRLEQVVRQVPCPTKFGYYLALDDPPFQGVLSESLVTLLRQFGMKEGELVNSLATTRSIDRLLKRQAAYYDPNLRADSAKEWIANQKV